MQLLWILGAVLVSGTLGFGWWSLSRPPLLAPPDQRLRVGVLGDDLARGSLGQDWISSSNSGQQRVCYLNLGRNFETIAQVSERLPELLEQDPERVVVVAGSWDVLARAQGKSATLSADCARLAEVLSRTGLPVAWVTPPLIGERTDGALYDALLEVVEQIQEQAESRGIAVLKLHRRMAEKLSTQGPERVDFSRLQALRLALAQRLLERDLAQISQERGWKLTVDGVHLNPAGAQELVALVEGWLQAPISHNPST